MLANYWTGEIFKQKTKENMDGFVISFSVMQVHRQELKMYYSEICRILKNLMEK